MPLSLEKKCLTSTIFVFTKNHGLLVVVMTLEDQEFREGNPQVADPGDCIIYIYTSILGGGFKCFFLIPFEEHISQMD